MGYHRAGYKVVGVDIEPQPHYPFEFHQMDAMDVLEDMVTTQTAHGNFDLIHASPPCQDHSALSALQEEEHDTGWMLPKTIELVKAIGLPWVVENVVGPSVVMDGWWFTLCGSMFGLNVRRHRRFGSSSMVITGGCRHDLQPDPIDVTGVGGPGGRHRKPQNLAHAREVMGIDWMTRKELSQAIPPAYTEYIGSVLLAGRI